MASSGVPHLNDDDDTMRDYVELQFTDEEVHTPQPDTGNSSKRKGKERASGDSSQTRKKTRSEVWLHFTKQVKNNDKCNCNYCGKEMCCSTKDGTTSLKKHYEHTCKSYQVWLNANKDKTQTVMTPEGAAGNLKVCKVSDSVVREATDEMLVLAELPLSFVESLAWKHFTSKVLLPRPHSRRTATRDIVMMYVNKKATMKKILGQNKQRVSLTTDIWVASVTGESYMVITAHFVDANYGDNSPEAPRRISR
uniref:Zinc finger BED domain-containing protein DAYSLEEPER n=1 Tax=Noccaea caerulescens TaxID=107243 RepID=A0A1J3JXX9_NOCCA